MPLLQRDQRRTRPEEDTGKEGNHKGCPYVGGLKQVKHGNTKNCHYELG